MSLKKKQKEGEEGANDGVESVLPPLRRPHPWICASNRRDLWRLGLPKQLYQVIDQNKANADQQSGTFFSSEMVTLSQVQQTRRSGSRRRRECLVQGSASVSGNR
jgi:hypothetical protein